MKTTLRIRALLVDTVLKEWTTGDAHDVTDRSFVVRRAIRINDALPGDKSGSLGMAARTVADGGSRDRPGDARSSCRITIPA